MSTEHALKAVADFLASQDAQAIALTGQWGRGKTHFWSKAIGDGAKENRFKKYAYVSLFGIDSLADLKAAIFENAVSPADLAGGATAQTWRKNVEEFLPETSASKAVGGAANAAQRLFGLSRKNAGQFLPAAGAWGAALRMASFLAVRNYVICLDDLERKGKHLSIAEILGLASLLTEQRGCRVIVILNDGALGDERDEFNSFREKVFDHEIVFAPTPEDCAAIAFPANWQHVGTATKCAAKLGITNIRVLQRIRKAIDAFYPLIKNLEPALLQSLIHSSVVLTWCYNSTLTDAPEYEFVKRLGYYTGVTLKKESGDDGDDKRGWLSLLNEYGYNATDEFDLQICRYLENGYLSDDQELRDVIRRADDEATETKAKGSFTDAWNLFHDTFANNETQFIEQLKERFFATAKWIVFNNAESTISLVRDLGYNELADSMIEHWIAVNKEYNPKKLDTSQVFFKGELRDEAFNKAVAEAHANDNRVPTLDETIRRIAGKNGWNPIDVLVMSQSSVEDYIRFFKSIDLDERLSSYVDACLQFGRFVNPQDGYLVIAERASTALRKIAAESRINALRISRYALVPLPGEIKA